MKYYYTRPDNSVAGPVALDEIRLLIANGILVPNPMIIVEGGTQWGPFSAIAGVPPAAPSAPTTPNWITIALKDAAESFKTLVTNPVGGLTPAFDRMGEARARGAGLIFGIIFAGCSIFAMYRFWGQNIGREPIFWRVAAISLMPFVSMVVATALVRMIFRGRPGFGQDVFVAGAALLPFALAILVAAIFFFNQPASTYSVRETMERNLLISFAVAGYLNVLMLFIGLTRIGRISERTATIGVPCALAGTIFLCVFFLDSLMK